jgi:hypothetical protein
VCIAVPHQNNVELEMKIIKYRILARQIAGDPDTQRRIRELISDLEKELSKFIGYRAGSLDVFQVLNGSLGWPQTCIDQRGMGY